MKSGTLIGIGITGAALYLLAKYNHEKVVSVVKQIGASAETSALAAGLSNEEAQMVAVSAMATATQSIENGNTTLRASEDAAIVIADAIGIEPEVVAEELVKNVTKPEPIPSIPVLEPEYQVVEPIRRRELTDSYVPQEAIQGLGVGNIFDWISNVAEDATDLYNEYAPVLDPLRDAAIQNAYQPNGGSPGGYYQVPSQPPVQNKTLGTAAIIGIAVGLVGMGLVTYAIVKPDKK